MTEQFKWVDYYEEFASKLLEYRNNRKELIDKIVKVYDILLFFFDAKCADVHSASAIFLQKRIYAVFMLLECIAGNLHGKKADKPYLFSCRRLSAVLFCTFLFSCFGLANILSHIQDERQRSFSRY